MRKTESQKIALCGMLGALSVVLLLIGSALQIGTYAAPMLAAFLLIPILEDYGARYALTLYATVSILAVLFVPETELAFFYVFVMGYYPVLRVRLNKIKSTAMRWVLKMHNGRTMPAFHWPMFSLGLFTFESMCLPASCTPASLPLLNGM